LSVEGLTTRHTFDEVATATFLVEQKLAPTEEGPSQWQATPHKARPLGNSLPDEAGTFQQTDLISSVTSLSFIHSKYRYRGSRQQRE
jgi:hypothetical protein